MHCLLIEHVELCDRNLKMIGPTIYLSVGEFVVGPTIQVKELEAADNFHFSSAVNKTDLPVLGVSTST